jgi:L-fuconolactonase
VLHAETAEKAMCLKPQFVASVKLLGELGLSFDLCMRPGELSDGLALAKQCPGTRFIVDHCGNADPSAFLKNAPHPISLFTIHKVA